MSGRLSTHVLDTSAGAPARGIRIDLYSCDAGGGRTLLKSVTTNQDGRTDAPLLSERELTPGVYEMVYHAGDYFRSCGRNLLSPAFLETIPIRFGISDANANWHVPLLLSPYAYSTYRGS